MAIAIFSTWIDTVRVYLRKENNHYQYIRLRGLCSLHHSVQWLWIFHYIVATDLLYFNSQCLAWIFKKSDLKKSIWNQVCALAVCAETELNRTKQQIEHLRCAAFPRRPFGSLFNEWMKFWAYNPLQIFNWFCSRIMAANLWKIYIYITYYNIKYILYVLYIHAYMYTDTHIYIYKYIYIYIYKYI